jgi:hypothetical protein
MANGKKYGNRRAEQSEVQAKNSLACATAEPVKEFIGSEETTKRKHKMKKRQVGCIPRTATQI